MMREAPSHQVIKASSGVTVRISIAHCRQLDALLAGRLEACLASGGQA